MKNQKTVFLIIYFLILALTLGIAAILYLEYRYFENEAKNLAQVKESYYQHVEMLKRSLNASMVCDGEEELELEKKKIINFDDDFITVDFTIDAIDEENPVQFEIISREEDDRLKQIKSTITKLKIPPIVKSKRIPKKIFYKSLKQKTHYIVK